MATSAAAAAAGPVERRERGVMLRALASDRTVSLLSVVAGLALWQLTAGYVSELILPAPSAVLARFTDAA
jgi:ABC-type nitrate/sulfonate/bicarbonate transport system permease component